MAEEPLPLFQRRTRNLTRSTLAGLQWAYLGAAAGTVVQFGMAAVMARLLSPTALGLAALAGLFLGASTVESRPLGRDDSRGERCGRGVPSRLRIKVNEHG
jgi:hypothetical protein